MIIRDANPSASQSKDTTFGTKVDDTTLDSGAVVIVGGSTIYIKSAIIQFLREK